MLEKLLGVIPSFVTGRVPRLALAAVTIDTILALVVLVGLTGLKTDKEYSLQPPPYPYVFVLLYLVFFFVIWFVIASQDRTQNQDGYSQVRKKLVGQWLVEYGSPYGLNSDTRLARGALGCSIHINPANQKLELKFRIHDNKIYADEEAQIIKVISLRNDHDYYYTLFYYFKGERHLQGAISEHIRPELGRYGSEKVEVEFLARLELEAPDNVVKVLRMNGEWYDLNGNISKLLALLSDIDQSKHSGIALPPRPLSDIGVPAFSASMGSIVFSRDS